MTDLSLVRGDSRNYQVTVTESDLVTPVDLTNAVVRFAIKAREGDPNTMAIVLLGSWDAAEIQKTDPTNGIVIVKLQARHTARVAARSYCWAVEVARRGALITSAGTVDVVTGQTIVTGSSLVLTDVGVGDILAPAGADAANQDDLVITAVGGDGSELDPGAGNLLTDYSAWVTETGISIGIYRGDIKTPTNLSGAFTLTKDTVS